MTKEEFIKLLDTLDFEEIRCATISYYKKKPKKNLSYWEESDDYNPKTICIGTNLESLINEEHTYTSNLFEEAIRRINDLEGVKNNEIRRD